MRLATTVFFAFGTVFWYAAQLATTWYQAHIVAVGLTMLAVGLALRRRSGGRRTTSRASTTRDAVPPPTDAAGLRPPASACGSTRASSCAGLLFGLAARPA